MISRGSAGALAVSPDSFSFNGTVILPAKHICCFRRLTLLSCDYLRIAWNALSFEILSCWKILGLLCGFCVVRHSLSLDQRMSGFRLVILRANINICFTPLSFGFSVSYFLAFVHFLSP
jgi:hypothetical protein